MTTIPKVDLSSFQGVLLISQRPTRPYSGRASDVLMQIRKTTQARVALLEAFAVFYALTAGSTNSPSSLANPIAIVRLAIPTLVIGVVLLLRNNWSDSKARAHSAAFVDIAFGFAAVLVSQAILALLKPELLLPQYRFTRGALIAWMFLTALRAWFPHRLKAARKIEAQTPITMERLRWNAIQFEVKIRQWSSWANLAAAAIIGLLALGLPFAGSLHAQLASGIFIAGAVYVAWIVHKRGSPGAAPLGGGWKVHTQYCQTELQRQSVLLHRLWHWYFGSLIPGVLLLLQGSTIYGCFILTYVLLIGELLYRAIEWIHLEISRIDSPPDSLRNRDPDPQLTESNL